MTDIYIGTGWSKTLVGCCKNGDIYKGSGWGKSCIGESKGDEQGAAAAALLLLLNK